MGHTDKVTVKLPTILGVEVEREPGVSVLTCVEVLAGAISEWNTVLQPLGMRIVLDIRLEATDGESVGAEEGSE